MASVKVERLVEELGLNPAFFESTGQMTGREFQIADERQLNQRTLLYDVVVEVRGREEPDLLDVVDVRWDADQRRIVMVTK